ncbi:exported protein of unknown function [Candidatus Filomicrobium marinum]|uniref:Uncharacterized protein n=1 Tax=Candidatus Filomicrobium marinum TaxID=1608628 RepID=A0A0D6JJB2_9HYPH|nr:DoxX family protein [Candidatus Filomicrobium marinum]CFX31033.1 exported protein of unknown function [Candidatus Filomicrobium marinum]CPR22048.1 exported protein of unknown function [Candidatus Filomicrobium marinum]
MRTRAMLWVGWGLSGLFALFMLGASVTPKLAQMPIAEETMAQLGWPPGYAFMIGIIELVCVVLFLIPRTSFFRASYRKTGSHFSGSILVCSARC